MSIEGSVTPVRSVRDARMTATVLERRPLLLADAPWAHVRAASAIVTGGRARLVVQDDALYVAVIGGPVIPLPPDADGSVLFPTSEKRRKPDLEAATVLADGRIVLFGSGATPARERLYVLRPAGAAEVVPAPELYAALRAALGPEVELNVEGAVVGARRLALLQRGNGRGAVDAELRIPLRWLLARLDGRPVRPPRVEVRRWDLGRLGGARLSFTDGVRIGPRTFAYLASAEDSPDAIADGLVAGSAIGFAGPRGGRWAPLVDPAGRVLPLKAEGLARGDRPDEWLVTTDPDDEHLPSELLRVSVQGAAAPGIGTITDTGSPGVT